MKKNLFQLVLIFLSILFSSNLVSSQEELRMSTSEKAWSVFYPNDKKDCFIVSQSIKDEAFRNGEKLSSVNRDRGLLYIYKSPNSEAGFEASFSAGYPLKIGGKFVLKVDGTKKIVFLASPKPQNSEEKNWAWTQVHDDKKLIEYAVDELTLITGQKAVATISKKDVASFKLRKGMPIGAKVTLRGERMYEFLDRLVTTALPRVRDFQGVKNTGFDGRGNYTLGVTEQIIFPEIDIDKVNRINGMDITFVTSARTDQEAKSLLTELGIPFKKN